MEEIQQFFIHQPLPPEVHNFVLDRAYGDTTSDTEVSTDSSTSWSILTPFPSYPVLNSTSHMQSGLFLQQGMEGAKSNLCAPVTVTALGDNNIR